MEMASANHEGCRWLQPTLHELASPRICITVHFCKLALFEQFNSDLCTTSSDRCTGKYCGVCVFFFPGVFQKNYSVTINSDTTELVIFLKIKVLGDELLLLCLVTEINRECKKKKMTAQGIKNNIL